MSRAPKPEGEGCWGDEECATGHCELATLTCGLKDICEGCDLAPSVPAPWLAEVPGTGFIRMVRGRPGNPVWLALYAGASGAQTKPPVCVMPGIERAP